MSRKQKPLPILEQVLITGLAAEGKAIAKTGEKVIFIPYAVPGDVVDLQVTRKKSNFLEARVIKFHQYSETRTTPFCEHFGICGGCKWQMLPYEEQLRYKQDEVVNNLTRIGKVTLPDISPIIGSEFTTFYRNKLEFTFSNKRWLSSSEMQENHTSESLNGLGFHIPGLFDKVLDINKCWLQEEISNRIRFSIKKFALENSYAFFNLRKQEGLLRTLIIRTSTTGELMVIVVFFYKDEEKIEKLLKHLSTEFPEISSLLYIVNSKANDTITDQKIIIYKGIDHIFEQMEGLRFKIGPKSFYQTNSLQAHELYKITRNFAQLTGNELVYDLYTGTGTIANFVASKVKQVIGIEYVPEAIEDAKINSELNGIGNTHFYAGDMKDILTSDFIEKHGKPDVIITDPPRAGMHGDVINAILYAAPKRVVYVSCNSATQARDLALMDKKYRVVAVQPVDMFPHTHHVENVVLLEQRI